MNVESSETIHGHGHAHGHGHGHIWKVIISMIKPLRIKAMSQLGPDV